MFKNLGNINFLGIGKSKHLEDSNAHITGTITILSDGYKKYLNLLSELVGKKVVFRLISSTKEQLGAKSYIKNWKQETSEIATEVVFTIDFNWDEVNYGVPGAFTIKNKHASEFFLKSMKLMRNSEEIKHFECQSWVYPSKLTMGKRRLFFSNDTYLPKNTPVALQSYREKELNDLRGDGFSILKEWDRVYDYATYSDLGTPDDPRPVLGGSLEYPYPRRGRTSRPSSESDPNVETRLPTLSLDIYVPRDEQFSQIKMSGFLNQSMKYLGRLMQPEVQLGLDAADFSSFFEVEFLFEKGVPLRQVKPSIFKDCLPSPILKTLKKTEPTDRFKTESIPDIIKRDKVAWQTDEEFARQMIAGENPTMIERLLEKLPRRSNLDPQVYGCQDSTVTKDKMITIMGKTRFEEAQRDGMLFILDHHDLVMPFLRRINSTATKTYATRTFLLLLENETLMPLAIELSLPHQDGDINGCTSQVYTRTAETGLDKTLWRWAKGYVAVNDAGIHHITSHWLNTHAVIEPFIIATNRELSVIHPVHKLLRTHFRDTMHINALARQYFINSNGILEKTVFAGIYAAEMSSAAYKGWNFEDQALPEDLLKRGMAFRSDYSSNLVLPIRDYPYAVDGLTVWYAIECWVENYCQHYYVTDANVKEDEELEAWWNEITHVGHGDKKWKHASLQTRGQLISTCTTIIWMCSGLHGAIQSSEYTYSGFLPNRPWLSRRLISEPNTTERNLMRNFEEQEFLKTFSKRSSTLIGLSYMELLSKRSPDESFLGRVERNYWDAINFPKDAYESFVSELDLVRETSIMKDTESSRDEVGYINRMGRVRVPYTFVRARLSENGKGADADGKGITNSASQ